MLELRSAGLSVCGWRGGVGGAVAYEDFRLIEQHVKGPGVNVNYTIRGLEGRPVCLEHKELEVQY